MQFSLNIFKIPTFFHR